MPATYHPLMSRVDEPAVEAVTEEPVAPETPVEPEAPVAPVESTPAEVAVPAATQEPEAPAEDRFIKLQRDSLHRDLEEMYESDPAFRNVLNSYVGRKAKRQYEPRMAELQADLAAAREQLRSSAVQGMDEDDIKERLLKDPEFRRNYDASEGDKPADIRVRAAFESAILQAEDAVARYVPGGVITQYNKMLLDGWFDYERDPTGRPVRQLNAQESLVAYNNALQAKARELVAARPAAAPPPPPPPAPAPEAVVAAPPPVEAPTPAPANSRLAQVNPDLSSPGPPSSGQVRMPLSEFKKLSPPQKKALYPDLADYERARREGIIYDD